MISKWVIELLTNPGLIDRIIVGMLNTIEILFILLCIKEAILWIKNRGNPK